MPVTVAPNIAAVLAVRWIRQDRNLTQKQLAELVGVSQEAIAKLERVESNVTLRTLTKVARALNCEVRLELTAA